MWRNNKQEQASKHVGGEMESVIKERSDDMPDNVNNSSTHISVLWKHFLTRTDIHCFTHALNV